MTLEIVCLGIGLLVSMFVAMRASSHARKAHALADSALSYQKRLSVLPREKLTDLVKDTVTKAIEERERLKPEGTYRENATSSRQQKNEVDDQQNGPPKVAKPFVCGQPVDVAFLDDGESEDKPLLRFSAVFARFSKDANGKTQVWLRCDEEKPEPYALEDVLLRHPGEVR